MAHPALQAIRRLQKAAKGKDEGRPAPVSLVALPGFREVEEMVLGDFARAGLVVRVRSRLLDEEVLFVSDNVRNVDEEGELVVYRAAELLLLGKLTPEGVRDVHRVKRIFRGSRVTEMNLDGLEEVVA